MFLLRLSTRIQLSTVPQGNYRRFDMRIKNSDKFFFGHLMKPISFRGGMCMWLTDVHTETCPLTLHYMRHIHACLGSTDMHTLQLWIIVLHIITQNEKKDKKSSKFITTYRHDSSTEYRYDVREREDNGRNIRKVLIFYYVSCGRLKAHVNTHLTPIPQRLVPVNTKPNSNGQDFQQVLLNN